MAIFKSSNPALTESSFEKSLELNSSVVMTEKGTLNKFFMLSLLVIASASLTWSAYYQGQDVTGWMWFGAIGGFIVALATIFKPKWSPVSAPIYALLEGVFVGAISAIYNNIFERLAPNIIMQAVGLTFGVVIAMFLLYRFRIIKVTERLRSIIFMATAGVMIFYLFAIVLRFFNIDIAFLHEGSMLGIGFSLFVVVLAAMNLLLNFDRIEKGVSLGAPKYMEWYGAFGLIVVIVWLYLEILSLLSKLSGRD
jgi:uncharacterized YccA/Bax inhibitor family protein